MLSKELTYRSREGSSAGLADSTIIVGTSCAGTGTDIPNVITIIIVGLPYSVEQALQWAGRCRGGGTVYVFVTAFCLDDGELSSECWMRVIDDWWYVIFGSALRALIPGVQELLRVRVPIVISMAG